MEEYWDRFMRSGAVRDYLEYKGIEMCMEIMQKYDDPAAGMGEKKIGTDYVYGNGPFDHSYR